MQERKNAIVARTCRYDKIKKSSSQPCIADYVSSTAEELDLDLLQTATCT